MALSLKTLICLLLLSSCAFYSKEKTPTRHPSSYEDEIRDARAINNLLELLNKRTVDATLAKQVLKDLYKVPSEKVLSHFQEIIRTRHIDLLETIATHYFADGTLNKDHPDYYEIIEKLFNGSFSQPSSLSMKTTILLSAKGNTDQRIFDLLLAHVRQGTDINSDEGKKFAQQLVASLTQFPDEWIGPHLLSLMRTSRNAQGLREIIQQYLVSGRINKENSLYYDLIKASFFRNDPEIKLNIIKLIDGDADPLLLPLLIHEAMTNTDLKDPEKTIAKKAVVALKKFPFDMLRPHLTHLISASQNKTTTNEIIKYTLLEQRIQEGDPSFKRLMEGAMKNNTDPELAKRLLTLQKTPQSFSCTDLVLPILKKN